MKFKFFFVSVFLMLCLDSMAQRIPVSEKVDDISVEECAFETYPADTSAAALVLWENCKADIDYSHTYGFCYHKVYSRRLKILKESGKSIASGAIYISKDKDESENVLRLTVTTYNLEDGKIVRTKAPKSSIVKSDYNENTQKIAFAAEGVKVGSVVEISYELFNTRFLDIPDFYFQSEIPVNLSTYSISIPVWMGFNRAMRGFDHIDNDTFKVNGERIEGIDDNTHRMDVYRAVDLPAFTDEAMLYCPDQYLDAISYEVTAVSLPGNFRDFSQKWETVATAVCESPICIVMNARSRFKDEVESICAGKTDDLEKLSAILDMVRSNVIWNEKITLVPDNQANVIKAHSGGSADVNAIAGSAFAAAGFKVSPVLVRLRSRGTLMTNRPMLSAFNTFILHVVTSDGKDLFVDAADPSGYFNVLPENYLVHSAFDVKGEASFEWVNLDNLSTNTTYYMVNAEVSDEGTVSGHLGGKYINVSSYDFKDTFRDYDNEDDLYEQMEKFIPVDISNMTVTGFDDFGDSSTLDLDFEAECETAGDMLIVNPFLFKILSDAAFTKEVRTFPVDFSYPEITRYVYTLKIPEGYAVAQLPKNCVYKSSLPSTMSFRVLTDGSTVRVQFQFDNKAMIALPDDYSEVRKYWTDVCAVFNERIIFKKAE